MAQQQQYWLYDGHSIKAVTLSGNEGWNIHGGPPSGDEADVKEYYVRVPFLNRAVDIRANAVSSLPFAIVSDSGVEIDTSDDYQNAIGFLPNPQRLLYLVESSLFLMAQSYLFRSYNRVKTLGLRYMVATTIEPQLDEELGLVGFRRHLATTVLEFEPYDLLYFWQLDPYVEIGPGNNSAAMAALSAAGVLFNVDGFASDFFERGAVKVTLLTTEGVVPDKERDRLKAWWSRLFRGRESSWEMAIVQADAVKPVVLGEGVKELSDSELIKEKREDIAAAAGIPVTLLWSTEAKGLGGGGVVESDERKFYEQTVVPQARFIEGVLNEQLFRPLGLRWRFRPETLDVFQTDENQRSQSFERYVNTGIRLSVAAQMLGLELPAGVDYADLDTMKQEDKEAAASRMPDFSGGQNPQGNPQQNPQRVSGGSPAMRADLRRWERKALNKGADCEFESDCIPPDTMDAIKALLAEATTDEEVKAAFAAPFREAAWESYP